MFQFKTSMVISDSKFNILVVWEKYYKGQKQDVSSSFLKNWIKQQQRTENGNF